MNRMAHRILQGTLITLFLLGALLTSPLLAQSTTATIRVEVADETGAPIPGLPLTLTHLPTGQALPFTTNEQGVVVARGLQIGGPYEVTLPPDTSPSR